jgi:hypothetical protein
MLFALPYGNMNGGTLSTSFAYIVDSPDKRYALVIENLELATSNSKSLYNKVKNEFGAYDDLYQHLPVSQRVLKFYKDTFTPYTGIGIYEGTHNDSKLNRL